MTIPKHRKTFGKQKNKIKYDWFEFGVFGLIKAEDLPIYRDELKKYGQKCTAVYFNKTEKEMFPILKKR